MSAPRRLSAGSSGPGATSGCFTFKAGGASPRPLVEETHVPSQGVITPQPHSADVLCRIPGSKRSWPNTSGQRGSPVASPALLCGTSHTGSTSQSRSCCLTPSQYTPRAPQSPVTTVPFQVPQDLCYPFPPAPRRDRAASSPACQDSQQRSPAAMLRAGAPQAAGCC